MKYELVLTGRFKRGLYRLLFRWKHRYIFKDFSYNLSPTASWHPESDA